MQDKIIIKGAREHNLKNIDLELPRDKFIVMTGLSGSGKSSLAFDTIFADGQRRYVESLSSYARQFLGQMDKPDCDSIEGLSPAISIDQKTTSRNPRSTVGTVTEIYDYLRLLYARIGIPHCPVCHKEIKAQTVDQIVDRLLELEEKTKIQILAPIIRGRKGEHLKEIDSIRKSGYVRIRIDGIMYDLSEKIKPEKNKKHNIEVVVDRLVIKEGIQSRLADSIETALNLSGGLVIADIVNSEEILFSQNFACPDHGISLEALSPRMFSFNSPFGACETCTGLGFFQKIDRELVVPDKELSINQGAIKASGWNTITEGTFAYMYYTAISKEYGISLDTPIKNLKDSELDLFLYGTNNHRLELKRPKEWGGGIYYHEFEGVINNLERRFKEAHTDAAHDELNAYMTEVECESCKGRRLKPEILAVTVGGLNISELCDLSIGQALEFFENLKLTEREEKIAFLVIKEIRERLSFLMSVGLDYLTLSRSAGSLSGGESQRIRLATQIGSALVGVLYILDEPSIGLHQRDNDKLIATLRRLTDQGNTLIVVEHDEDTMLACDHIVDIGPGAGIHGGQIIYSGTPQGLLECEGSVTGRYLSGKCSIPMPLARRGGNGNYLEIKGAYANNLKDVDVKIPLGELVCITGVSGSGKSSLINEILYKHLAHELNRARAKATKFKEINGLENLDKVIAIDQSPIGRMPSSNPATYTGLFTHIRELFAQTQEAKMRGYGPGRFSFNVKGGRCEACRGDGIVRIEMHFLPDIYVPCEVCKGERYNRETLEVRYKGKNIHDVLEMTVDEGVEFFEALPKISRKLKTLQDVGLGYIKIGQSATTLSGGEAQRVKLATELSKRSTGKTLYVLDEPTTGLHTADVHKLIEVLQKLVDAGNSVLVIEHNLHLIKCADHIIDMGPHGGDKGGCVIAQGAPEEIALSENSFTGQYLKKMLSL